MQLLLDSAIIGEARQAASWGWVSGATTNPTLLAQSNLPPRRTLKKLGKLLRGPIFYQLTSADLSSMADEAKMAAEILGSQLVLKIPATELGFQAAAILSGKYACAITSIFTPAQALVAHASGARYALYYHNRAKRLLKDGAHLASRLVAVLEGTGTQVVAASLKTADELVEARLAGAQVLSAKFEVLVQLPFSEHSQAAVDDFSKTGIGLMQNLPREQA